MVFSHRSLMAPGRGRGEAMTRSADGARATARCDPSATRERFEGGGQVPPRRTRRQWAPPRKKPWGTRRAMAPRAPDSAMHRSSSRPHRRCICTCPGQRAFPAAPQHGSALPHARPRCRSHGGAMRRRGWGRARLPTHARPRRSIALLASARGSARNAASSHWRALEAAVQQPTARRSGAEATHACRNFNRSDMPLCSLLAEPG